MAVRSSLLVILVALASSLVRAEPYLYKNYKCVSPSERREIHVYRNSEEPPAGPACRLDYLKQGSTRTLWTAQNNVEFCTEKAEELSASLEEVGFKCVATASFD